MKTELLEAQALLDRAQALITKAKRTKKTMKVSIELNIVWSNIDNAIESLDAMIRSLN